VTLVGVIYSGAHDAHVVRMVGVGALTRAAIGRQS
jgi:hypothetical protein